MLLSSLIQSLIFVLKLIDQNISTIQCPITVQQLISISMKSSNKIQYQSTSSFFSAKKF